MAGAASVSDGTLLLSVHESVTQLALASRTPFPSAHACALVGKEVGRRVLVPHRALEQFVRARTIQLQRAVDSPLFRKKRTVTDPEFCEGFKILLVSAGHCVFLPAFNAKTILSRRVLLDL
jgi:hypothetical protein